MHGAMAYKVIDFFCVCLGLVGRLLVGWRRVSIAKYRVDDDDESECAEKLEFINSYIFCK